MTRWWDALRYRIRLGLKAVGIFISMRRISWGGLIHGGLANRPNNGEYHIFHEYSLDSQDRYSSDAAQFNRANVDFVKKMGTNPKFRQDMLNRYPKLNDWLKDGDMSRSPSGLTWHHHEDINRLTLVDRADHRSTHSLYHPTSKGGRDIWGGGKLGRQGKLDGPTGRKICS